jgi:hypothetical protein
MVLRVMMSVTRTRKWKKNFAQIVVPKLYFIDVDRAVVIGRLFPWKRLVVALWRQLNSGWNLKPII